ncbi:nicotinate-nucleotide adenylyltransferase [Thalassomonas viridans]|uniref:Probable nicotinate-nucleotide adenylyltransferase n=1 Tax=Thalassomonas viridans TaxID=137584 RepID=A0AAF0C7M4_9GAMM|nr:nicotinate-nucleotide adenylyltransferase [Thalassomonas viridans]WDE03853.1 nicotinate-nucleotide adenylyltransferase [Thalassomonas viridans]
MKTSDNLPEKTQKAGAKTSDIGILGGTFDPIHLGHINPAKELLRWLGLKELVLMPAAIPPHKAGTSASARQRADMVKLVCGQEKVFHCDERELKRAATSYTLATLLEIKKEHPHQRIFFIIGMDSLFTFTRWHKWQEILTLCHLVVNTRPGYETADMPADTRQLLARHQVTDVGALKQSMAGHIILAPESRWDISSTGIRQQLKSGEDCRHLLPAPVLTYIRQHNLYR